MSNTNIEDRVKKIIVDMLGVSAEDVVPEASFVDDLGADSLDTVELVMALEEEFETEIPDDGEPDITNSIAMRQMFNAASMIRYLQTTDFLGLPKSARRIGL